jgi:hypothetical protein
MRRAAHPPARPHIAAHRAATVGSGHRRPEDTVVAPYGRGTVGGPDLPVCRGLKPKPQTKADREVRPTEGLGLLYRGER